MIFVRQLEVSAFWIVLCFWNLKPREGYFKGSEFLGCWTLKSKTKMRILNTCIRIRNHRSKGYKNLKKITLFGKHNSISLRPVRDIFVHKDNIPSLKYIRNNHVCRDYYSFNIFIDLNKSFWSSLLIPLVCTRRSIFARASRGVTWKDFCSSSMPSGSSLSSLSCQARFFLFCLRIH